jgi:signal transduction histidine kinase
MPRYIALLLFVFSSFCLQAQRIVEIDDHTSRQSLVGYLTYDVDYAKSGSFELLKKTFKPKPITKEPNFGDSPLPHWIRFRLHYTGKQPKSLSLVTKGVDTLDVYVTDVRFNTLQHYQSGSHYPMAQREAASPFLSASFKVQPDSTYWVWTRIRNVHYRLAASPFILYDTSTSRDYFFVQHFYQSLYIGSMALFLLLGIVLAYFFREKIYWYYLGCVACALCIMLVYNDYGYVFVKQLPDFVLNKNILGLLSATVPVFYLLFAEQFLEVRPQAFPNLFRLSRMVIVLQYLCIAALMLWGQPLFEYKLLFYVFMGILSTINLVYLATKWPSPAAKLFAWATLPVTVTVLTETLSDIHQWPVQDIHNTYYFTTFVELIVLTGGIVYRFKENQTERYKLEEEKYRLENEILKIEFNTQRRERNEIADEMRDELGSLLAASKFQAELLIMEHPQTKWEDIKQQLSDAYRRVRDLSYQLRTNDEETLQSELVNKYKRISAVNFRFAGLYDIRFEPFVEAQLSSIISELITNALKHAQCTSIRVRLNYEQPLLGIIVEDDGIGFDTKATQAQIEGSGLRNIEKRITENMKGQFEIESSPSGTTATIKVKLLPRMY